LGFCYPRVDSGPLPSVLGQVQYTWRSAGMGPIPDYDTATAQSGVRERPSGIGRPADRRWAWGQSGVHDHHGRFLPQFDEEWARGESAWAIATPGCFKEAAPDRSVVRELEALSGLSSPALEGMAEALSRPRAATWVPGRDATDGEGALAAKGELRGVAAIVAGQCDQGGILRSSGGFVLGQSVWDDRGATGCCPGNPTQAKDAMPQVAPSGRRLGLWSEGGRRQEF